MSMWYELFSALGLTDRFARLPFYDLTVLRITYRPDQERFYPEVSRLARESGAVRVALAVNPHGVPLRARMLESSGYLRLDAAAQRLALEFRFVTPADPKAQGGWQTQLRVIFGADVQSPPR